ncbi:hypothetical protein KSS87_005579, partial [Heliosperma pusillum]
MFHHCFHQILHFTLCDYIGWMRNSGVGCERLELSLVA